VTPAPRRILYGRRRGRRRRAGRGALLATRLEPLAVSLDGVAAGSLDPRLLFGPGATEVWLEIGFGAGEHLAEQARDHREVGFLGCEPFIDGVASLLRHVEHEELGNIRLFVDDARSMVDAMLTSSIGRAFLLFPDPWPKMRHHKRRFLEPASVAGLARVLRPGAELRVATDHLGYCRWALAHLLAHPAFRWTAERASDWRERPADWPPTRYEIKAIAAGRAPVYLRFVRSAGEQNAMNTGVGHLK